MRRTAYYSSPLRRDYTINPTSAARPKSNHYKPEEPQQSSEEESHNSTDHTKSLDNQEYLKQQYIDGLLLKKESKNHTGLFILENHGVLLFTFLEGRPFAKNYFIHPKGITISAIYEMNGKLEGHMIAYCKRKFITISSYRRGIKHGEQFWYSFED